MSAEPLVMDGDLWLSMMEQSMKTRDLRRDTAEQLGWRPVVGHFALFGIDLVSVTVIGSDPKTGDQHVARWPQRDKYLRAATTPTSLGPPTDVHRIFE